MGRRRIASLVHDLELERAKGSGFMVCGSWLTDVEVMTK